MYLFDWFKTLYNLIPFFYSLHALGIIFPNPYAVIIIETLEAELHCYIDLNLYICNCSKAFWMSWKGPLHWLLLKI